MFLRNFWYTAACSSELKHEPFPRTILSEKVVMYRKLDGTIAALADRCTHQQAPLSTGTLCGDVLRCAYHGFEFDPSGRRVPPRGQEKLVFRARVKTYPVAERHGFVWIWMGDPARADESTIPNYWMCSSPQYAGKTIMAHIEADWQLGIDNLLALSRFDLAAPDTDAGLGAAEIPPETRLSENEVTVSRFFPNEATPPLFRRTMEVERVDRSQVARYWPAANILVKSTARPAGANNDAHALVVYTPTLFTPETESTAFAFAGTWRDFDLEDEQLTETMTGQVLKTLHEAKRIAEHEQCNRDPDAPAADRAANGARRIVHRLYEHDADDRPAAMAAGGLRFP
jgi:phenylpropionate dioxygenase-like ring-hydroxylating dioxygenase large terminal subunit